MDGEQMTDCWCPKCESFHRIRIRWIGRGIPRIYCRYCKGQCELTAEIIYPVPQIEREGSC
jgi:transposase-like protein